MLNTTIDTSDTRVHYVMYIYYVCVCVFFFFRDYGRKVMTRYCYSILMYVNLNQLKIDNENENI